MASVRTEFVIEASPDDVWAVIRDFGTGPHRMAPGHVVDTRVEADVRVVTFANGTVARERFVAVDDGQRRIVYALIEGTVRPDHDNASMQVLADGERRSRFVWIHDVLPDSLAAPIHTAMEQGARVIKHTMESQD